jgi:glycosyltransferase involved in cell wall biosynthesis
MSKRKVVILGKLPPPYMGPAIATGIILNSELRNRFELLFLNTKANESINTLGKWNLSKIFKNISIYGKLLRMAVKHKPHLVLVPVSQTTTGFIKDSFFILIARLCGRKVLIQLRGSNFKNWIGGASGFTKAYVKWILKRTQGVIVLGNNLKYLFADYFRPQQIFVVPNGANYEVPARQSHSDEVKILYLSNLLASKGITDVFDAVRLLKDMPGLPAFSVDLIGEWLPGETKQ